MAGDYVCSIVGVILLSATCVLALFPEFDDSVPVHVRKDNPTPRHGNPAQRARHIVHRATWCTVVTMSTMDPFIGRPFPNILSVSDGPAANGTGTPYFYDADVDNAIRDIGKNDDVTLGFTEAAFGDVTECQVTDTWDPELPLCARLLFFGKLVNITGTDEEPFARKAMFSRHPAMKYWTFHRNYFYKLAITHVWLFDYFGNGKIVPLEEYYAASP